MMFGFGMADNTQHGFPFHEQEGVEGGHVNCADGAALEEYVSQSPERQFRREWLKEHGAQNIGYFHRSGAAGPDELPAYLG